MLSFDSSLNSALLKDNTQSYWLLRLYYDATNFTGFTNGQPRPTNQTGGDMYWAAISISRPNQEINLGDFSVNNNTLTVKIPNTPKAVEGQRFSDLFSTRNYSNKKWELYQCDVGATFSTDNLLASGNIGSRISHDDLECTLYLNDWWLTRDSLLPTHRITKDVYTNAPEANYNLPVPMWYGDFGILSGVPAGSNWERYRVGGHVPAPIVDKGDTTGYVQILPDTDQDDNVILHTLNEKNVYMYNQGYLACDDANVGLTASPTLKAHNKILFTGNTFKVFYPFARDKGTGALTVTNAENMFDDDFDTLGSISCIAGALRDIEIELPEIVNMGQATNITVLGYFGAFTGDPDGGGGSGVNCFYVYKTGAAHVYWDWDGAKYQECDMGQYFSDSVMEGMQLSGLDMAMWIDDDNNNGGGAVEIKMLGVEIDVEADKTYKHREVYYKKEIFVEHFGAAPRLITKAHDRIIELPEVEMCFVAGKGRKFGSWIQTGRSNGYSTGALIENPVYIIEDILRTELGLTSTEIDISSFDTAGNTTNGEIGNTFNDSVGDIKFAFSQYKEIAAKKLIRKICQLSGLYFFWSAGKAKVVARQQSYSTKDGTIDWRYVGYPSEFAPNVEKPNVYLTDMGDIINHITLEHSYDYGAKKTTGLVTPEDDAGLTDATSISDYGATLKATIGNDLSKDETTVKNYGYAQLGWFKDRHICVDLEIVSAIYNKYEIGDIIALDNVPSTYKMFGTEILNTMPFMIYGKLPSPSGCIFKFVKVTGSV